MDGINIRDIVKRTILADTTIDSDAIDKEDVVGGGLIALMDDDVADDARWFFGVF
jgi:hypothetical protein